LLPNWNKIENDIKVTPGKGYPGQHGIHLYFFIFVLRKNIYGKIIKNRNIIEDRRCEAENSNEWIGQYILGNKKNKEKCIRNGIKYFEIDKNYEKEVERIYKWIDKEMEKNK
jgi:putative acetyltransferase